MEETQLFKWEPAADQIEFYESPNTEGNVILYFHLYSYIRDPFFFILII